MEVHFDLHHAVGFNTQKWTFSLLTLQQHYAKFSENGKSGLARYTINNIRIK